MRNQTIDLVRGFAIILVIICHVMLLQGQPREDTNTLLFRIVWTLQMPLFFLISGYVNRYSNKPLNNIKDLGLVILKRTKAYLMPLIVWTFVIKGILLSQTYLFDINSFIKNTGGYWFLASLWTITIIFTLSKYLFIRYLKNGGGG